MDEDLIFERMAARDDSIVVDESVREALAGKTREWCYWQGYIEAYCDQNALNLQELEVEYQRRIAWAAGSLAEFAAKREP